MVISIYTSLYILKVRHELCAFPLSNKMILTQSVALQIEYAH